MTDRTRARDYFAEYHAAVAAYGREIEKAFGFAFMSEHDRRGKDAAPGSALRQAYDAMAEARRERAPARNMDRITKIAGFRRLFQGAVAQRRRGKSVEFDPGLFHQRCSSPIHSFQRDGLAFVLQFRRLVDTPPS
ncbi:MAG: hypothetical protein ACJ73N_15530 [Bryobacteraceae bacterium]